MEEKRQIPGPWSWAHTGAALLIGIFAVAGQRFAGDVGMLVGLLAGVIVSLSILLFWHIRPRRDK